MPATNQQQGSRKTVRKQPENPAAYVGRI